MSLIILLLITCSHTVFTLAFIQESFRESLSFAGKPWSHSHPEAAQCNHSFDRWPLSSVTGAAGVESPAQGQWWWWWRGKFPWDSQEDGCTPGWLSWCLCGVFYFCYLWQVFIILSGLPGCFLYWFILSFCDMSEPWSFGAPRITTPNCISHVKRHRRALLDASKSS